MLSGHQLICSTAPAEKEVQFVSAIHATGVDPASLVELAKRVPVTASLHGLAPEGQLFLCGSAMHAFADEGG